MPPQRPRQLSPAQRCTVTASPGLVTASPGLVTASPGLVGGFSRQRRPRLAGSINGSVIRR
jgi:hypothetical protein